MRSYRSLKSCCIVCRLCTTGLWKGCRQQRRREKCWLGRTAASRSVFACKKHEKRSKSARHAYRTGNYLVFLRVWDVRVSWTMLFVTEVHCSQAIIPKYHALLSIRNPCEIEYQKQHKKLMNEKPKTRPDLYDKHRVRREHPIVPTCFDSISLHILCDEFGAC